MKVAEWQQTYYASDSGIQSGATTLRDDEDSECGGGGRKYTIANANANMAAESSSGRLLPFSSYTLVQIN